MKKKASKKAAIKKIPQTDIKNDDVPKMSFGDALKKITNANTKNIKDDT